MKIEPKIGYTFGSFVELEEEEILFNLVFNLAKIKNKKGRIMHKRIEAKNSMRNIFDPKGTRNGVICGRRLVCEYYNEKMEVSIYRVIISLKRHFPK